METIVPDQNQNDLKISLNKALGLMSIPYLGFYNKEGYDLIHPQKIFNQSDYKLIQYFPKKMRNAIENFLKVHSDADIQICLINYDASNYRKSENLSKLLNYL